MAALGPEEPVRRVLVVDDDPTFSSMLADALEDEGFDVVAVAKDGLHGVTLAREAAPDAIVLDMRMPALDGIAAARQIRTFNPTVRLILLSAYDDPTLKREAATVGAARYLVKGCRLSDLVAALTD
jgi:CheY-like chemotaxis protein